MIGPKFYLLQLLPPLVVMVLLIVASVYFYKRYVRPSKSLILQLQKITETVRSMSDGDEVIRKAGVARVFQGSQIESVWKDFSRTLHSQTGMVNGSNKVKRYRLTAPVALYFSPSAIVDRPLAVDYFKHLPGILTGIGIIGTFSGLLFGLSYFDATSPEKMARSVSLLMSGVRDAFYASAAAITVAMVITHWEKLLYRKCTAALESLVEALNGLFEGGIGEEYLASLANSSSHSTDFAKSLKDELIQAMVPVIKQLENIQSQQVLGMQEALEGALSESNRRLASQMEASLIRHVKTPIEDLGKRLEGRLNHLSSPGPQDMARKVIRARQQDGRADSPSEAA